MTFRQAMYKASIELGFTEEEIKRRGARSDAIMANISGPASLQILDKELELRPGVTEEQFIESVKPFISKILKMPDAQKAGMIAASVKKFEQQTTQN